MRILIIKILFPLFSILLWDTSYAFSYIDSRTGVEIIWEKNDIYKEKYSGLHVSELKSQNRKRILKVVKRELDKYPSSIIKGKLHTIYLVKKISQNNITIGGQARGGSIIYLGRSNTSGMVSKIHHEIAHILFNNYRFSGFDRWNAINPSNFIYIGSGLQSISSGAANQKVGKDRLKQGFISSYAQASLQEDFAELAENAITGGRNFRQKIRTYDKLRQKFAILKEFYISIDDKLSKLF